MSHLILLLYSRKNWNPEKGSSLSKIKQSLLETELGLKYLADHLQISSYFPIHDLTLSSQQPCRESIAYCPHLWMGWGPEKSYHELCDPVELGLEARHLTLDQSPLPSFFCSVPNPRTDPLFSLKEGNPETCIQNYYFIRVQQYFHRHVKQMAHLQINLSGQGWGLHDP